MKNMPYDITLHICHCILPYLSKLWCEELYNLSLTCRTIYEYVRIYHGRIIVLPNQVPYYIRGDELYMSMTQTYKCIIEYKNSDICIISHHTKGYVTSKKYNITYNTLEEYSRGSLIRNYHLVIYRARIGGICIINPYKPKVLRRPHNTVLIPCLDYTVHSISDYVK